MSITFKNIVLLLCLYVLFIQDIFHMHAQHYNSCDDIVETLKDKLAQNDLITADELEAMFETVISANEFDASKARLLNNLDMYYCKNFMRLYSDSKRIEKISRCARYFELRSNRRSLDYIIYSVAIIGFICLIIGGLLQLKDFIGRDDLKKNAQAVAMHARAAGNSQGAPNNPIPSLKEYTWIELILGIGGAVVTVAGTSWTLHIMLKSFYEDYRRFHDRIKDLEKLLSPDELAAVKKSFMPLKKFFKQYPALRYSKDFPILEFT